LNVMIATLSSGLSSYRMYWYWAAVCIATSLS
jgi:hypothetical protein